jgi:amino acid transporter
MAPNDIPPFLLVASGTFFAMSFGRMLPESSACVSEKWHSPIWAVIVTGVAAMLGAVAESARAIIWHFFTQILRSLFLPGNVRFCPVLFHYGLAYDIV